LRKFLSTCLERKDVTTKNLTEKIDKVMLHPFWGYVIFLGVLMLIFQAIFAWAEWPMDLIDGLFATLSDGTKSNIAPVPSPTC